MEMMIRAGLYIVGLITGIVIMTVVSSGSYNKGYEDGLS